MTSELSTLRLELRPPTEELLDTIWRAVERSLPELRVWMHWAALDPRPEATLDYIKHAQTEWHDGLERTFTIFHEGEAAGGISLMQVRQLFQRAEIGYWLRSDLCGRGLMTEAASAVVCFGFDAMDLHRIELHAALENVASIRVAEKLGFQREGISRDAGKGADGYQDVYVYGLLETDPRPAFHLTD